MPFSMSKENNDSIITVEYNGLLTSYEMYEACKEMFADIDKVMEYELIISDFSKVKETHLRDLDIKRLVKACDAAARYKKDLTAVFIMPTTFLFSLGRIWHEHACTLPWKIKVVKSKKDATDWINALSNVI